MGRTLWRHSSQRSSSSATVLVWAAAVLAGADLGEQPGLGLLGLALGPGGG